MNCLSNPKRFDFSTCFVFTYSTTNSTQKLSQVTIGQKPSGSVPPNDLGPMRFSSFLVADYPNMWIKWQANGKHFVVESWTMGRPWVSLSIWVYLVEVEQCCIEGFCSENTPIIPKSDIVIIVEIYRESHQQPELHLQSDPLAHVTSTFVKVCFWANVSQLTKLGHTNWWQHGPVATSMFKLVSYWLPSGELTVCN